MKKIMLWSGLLLVACLILYMNCRTINPETVVLTAPAGNRLTKIDTNGATVIPNGRLLTPVGRLLRVAPHPYGLVKSPDGKIIVTSNSGTKPFSLSILRDFHTAAPQVRQIPEPGQSGVGLLETVFMGLAVTRDNKFVYASTGGGGEIRIFDLDSRRTGGHDIAERPFSRK